MYVSYKDKLKHPRWQKRKAEILLRDNYTCQAADCGDKESTLHVHHLEYFKDLSPWEYPNDMLITLCEKCHNKELGRIELEINLATTMKMKGFLFCDLLAFSSKIDTDIVFTATLLKILRNYQE